MPEKCKMNWIKLERMIMIKHTWSSMNTLPSLGLKPRTYHKANQQRSTLESALSSQHTSNVREVEITESDPAPISKGQAGEAGSNRNIQGSLDIWRCAVSGSCNALPFDLRLHQLGPKDHREQAGAFLHRSILVKYVTKLYNVSI